MRLTSNLVIGLCGRARTGKNTCAEYIAKWLHLAGIREAGKPVYIGFAEGMKYDIMRTFDISAAQLDKAKTTTLGRWILEKVGTELYTRDSVIATVSQRIADLKAGPNVILLTDVRFPDESTFIREQLRGVVIRIRHEPTDTKESVNPTERNIEAVTYDTVITNDHGLHHLDFQCRDVANQIMYSLPKTKNIIT